MNGPNDKLSVLLERLLSKMTNFDMYLSEESFETELKKVNYVAYLFLW